MADVVDDTLRSMTVAQKVGQLFVAPVGRHSPNAVRLSPTEWGSDEPNEVAEWIDRYHLGGVCYFPTRLEGDEPADVAALLDRLRGAMPAGGVPVLFSIDQEGGTVARMRRGVTPTPSAMALAATGDPAAVEDVASIIGAELRAVGFHLDYAPCADVNVNPANPVIGVRSFGSHPAAVGRYVAAYVRGLRSAGVGATVKHFPGHGDTSGDSHLMLPVVTHDRLDLLYQDFPPFTAAIKAGVEAVMTAHVFVPALDGSGAPATCSRAVLSDWLRGHLGFTGPVVTDALDMAGARARYGDEEVAVRALLAGADQLLMPADLPAAVAAVRRAVEAGDVPMTRVDEAVRRTLALKQRLGVLDGRAGGGSLASLASPERLAASRRISAAGLTVRGERDALRLHPDAVTLVGALEPVGTAVADALGVPADRRHDTGFDPSAEEVSQTVSALAGADLVVAVSADATRSPGQQALLAALDAAEVRYVLLATGAPYDARLAPKAAATLFTYGEGAAAVQAAIAVLTGAAEPGGTLPVDLPHEHDDSDPS
ncbi:MAG TPA: glycoside hydrolase family 3 protein [Streptosporangiales bacterium]